MKIIFVIFFTVLMGQPVFAQDEGGGGGDGGAEGPQNSQFGYFIGRVLPNGVTDEDEIYTLWGLRYSMHRKSSQFFDFGTINGNSEGVKWNSLFFSISTQIPVETLIGHAGVGLDLIRYETGTIDTTNKGSVHFIGGIMSKIGSGTYLRFDMKLNQMPGTFLYFALGLSMELGGGGGDAGGDK